MMKAIGIKPGVLFGDDITKVFQYCKDNKFALPAVNCTSSSTINAVLEAARKNKSPVIIQFSNGGAAFIAGKGVCNTDQKAAILGSIAGARHVHAMAEAYGVPVILHTDHCSKKLLPWLDGCIAASEEEFAKTGHPLFSMHMVDLSEEPHDENIAITSKYLERMSKMNMTLEMEIGITGGEEDGVNNDNVDPDKLYSTPEDIELVYTTLNKISNKFTIAAAFGNVHGVYKPGNVVLRPEILGQCQEHIRTKFELSEHNPCFFVFHGGSGSSDEDIKAALEHGVIKMNIDTDTQWAYWDGIKGFYEDKKDYLQGQMGNPEGDDKPNKKNYDPRVWIRKAEESMIRRLDEAFISLNCVNRC
uniref:fructose-bisphosphate aldolase n=1 Tax=Hirondellea gigas TaxID=1518452 RepID=A0A6A7GAH2_9CRUS